MTRPTKLTDVEVAEKLTQIPEWKLLETGEIGRTYSFAEKGDFVSAIRFVNNAAGFAEAMQHHPNIDIRYNRVTCFVSTHDVGGLTELDFELAGKLDQTYLDVAK